MNHLLAHIINSSAYVVSDGSFYPITKTDGSVWIHGGGIITGRQRDRDPYRSELGVQLGIAAFVSEIILPSNFKPTLTLGFYGISDLNQVGMGYSKIKAKLRIWI